MIAILEENNSGDPFAFVRTQPKPYNKHAPCTSGVQSSRLDILPNPSSMLHVFDSTIPFSDESVYLSKSVSDIEV